MMRFLGTLLLTIITSCFIGQEKKIIDHSAYDEWNSITSEQISTYGNIVTYQIRPLRSDYSLMIHNIKSKTTANLPRSKQAKILHNEEAVVFMISPGYDTIRDLKIKDVPKKKWPKDSLGIWLAQNDSIIKFSKVANYKIGSLGGNSVGMLHDKSFELPKPESKKKKCFVKKNKKDALVRKYKGQVFRAVLPELGVEKTVEGVTLYEMSENGSEWGIVQNITHQDSIDSVYLQIVSGAVLESRIVWKAVGEIKQFSFDEKGEQAAFLFSADTGKTKNYQLYLYKNDSVELLVDTIATIFDAQRAVSEYKKPYFSKNGTRLYFGVGDKKLREPEDSIPNDEKARFDLWSWTDGKIQPQQLLELEEEQKKSDLFVYHIEKNKFIQLSDSSIESIHIPFQNNGKYALTYSQAPYYKEMTWDTWYFDYFRVDVTTGEKRTLQKHHKHRLSLSPSGKYAAYYSGSDSSWYLIDVETSTEKNLTSQLEAKFFRKFHDVPGEAGAVANVFWVKGEDQLIIRDQNDYWMIATESEAAVRLTKGRENRVIYEVVKFDSEEEYIDLKKPIWFKTFNERTKNEGMAVFRNDAVDQIFDEPFQSLNIKKSDSTDKVIFRQASLKRYPDLLLTDLSFEKRKQLSNANEQQKNYNWATVELVNWKDYNGDSLAGLLYKPEDFDSTKKYPLLVYFYERNSDELHRHYSPKPTASIIFPTEYASSGYVIFIPDIPYEVGHPAKSAFNAIVSGTDALLKQYSYLDSTRMGLQGQSWGGYQTAQLITMTNKYKCAMAGAPVSNMFSAYGGIRWGSGLNRAFQYEKGQSRIGQTIWEAPELYIENSPLFRLPEVETPLLIMHNDGDGAVPWYQGIELFMGLRRLNKPVWMLNYNDDQHNLMKQANRRDLSVRMKEFFDHYLLDAPQPKWMKDGISAVDNPKNK